MGRHRRPTVTQRQGHGRRELLIEFPAGIRSLAIDALCEQVGSLLAYDTGVILICDLSAVDAPDLSLIDALARLRLSARRHGVPMVIRHACAMVCGLIDLVGLDDTLPYNSHTERPGANGALPPAEGGASE